MKIVLSLILAFALTGCYQTVNLRDIKDAAIICGDIDKISHISANILGDESVTCNDRHFYRISSERIKEKSK